jgi:pantoate--beta-alanine ligase
MNPPVWETVSALRQGLREIRSDGGRVVLVPTMGDLHEGHLSLVRAAHEFGSVVVSIFVNPTQFAPGEDLDNYPRRLAEDVDRLRSMRVGGIFAPGIEEMYPPGESTRVEVRGLSEPLCGAHREGHFLGVTTICTKLFVITDCELAVFGEKDAQQCLVIRRLVRDLRIGTDLLFVPTERDAAGLALSSRNRYLDDADRKRALALRRALLAGRQALVEGERDVARVEAAMAAVLDAAAARRDYSELRDLPDLGHPERAEGRVLLAVAAHVGPARLIDNLSLEVGEVVRESPLLVEHTPEAVADRWFRSPNDRGETT